MAKLLNFLRSVQGGGLMFHCPGCGENHVVFVGQGDGPRWEYNGNPEKPTFSLSVLVRSGHYASTKKDGDSCWCTFNEEQIANGEPPSKFKCGVCHSFVTDGRIQFLADCTHDLAGQTVELPPYFEGDE